MRLADGITKHGFRKWYERELTQSHIHLVLLFLCAIGLLTVLEVFSRSAPLSDRVGNVISLLLCVGIGLWALRRYLYLLMHAEEIANQAVCAQCKAYGKFALLRDDRQQQQVTVRCKCCNHEWPISDTAPE